MTSWTLRGTGHVTLRAKDDVILPDLGMKTVAKFVENIVKLQILKVFGSHLNIIQIWCYFSDAYKHDIPDGKYPFVVKYDDDNFGVVVK